MNEFSIKIINEAYFQLNGYVNKEWENMNWWKSKSNCRNSNASTKGTVWNAFCAGEIIQSYLFENYAGNFGHTPILSKQNCDQYDVDNTIAREVVLFSFRVLVWCKMFSFTIEEEFLCALAGVWMSQNFLDNGFLRKSGTRPLNI